MATAGDLIRRALTAGGIIADGEIPTASMQSDALDVFNDILEEWSNDGYMLFEKKIESFPFVAGKGLYTIGAGADLNTSRPMNILGAKIKISGGYELPLKVWNYQEWAKICARELESDYPHGIYYNAAYPAGEINVWPIPETTEASLILYSLKPLVLLPNAATEIVFPPGYKKALRLTAATELRMEYGKPADPKLEDMATKARAAIQRTNTDELLMECDAFGLNEARESNMWRIIT